MKNDLLSAVLAVTVSIVAVGVCAWTINRLRMNQPPPCPKVNCIVLDADPDEYLGREVILKTAGMEVAENNRELFYRKRTDLSPCVVAYLKAPLTGQIPETIKGFCLGRTSGAAVVVVDCRP